jgi:hypothetical protein
MHFWALDVLSFLKYAELQRTNGSASTANENHVHAHAARDCDFVTYFSVDVA